MIWDAKSVTRVQFPALTKKTADVDLRQVNKYHQSIWENGLTKACCKLSIKKKKSLCIRIGLARPAIRLSFFALNKQRASGITVLKGHSVFNNIIKFYCCYYVKVLKSIESILWRLLLLSFYWHFIGLMWWSKFSLLFSFNLLLSFQPIRVLSNQTCTINKATDCRFAARSEQEID